MSERITCEECRFYDAESSLCRRRSPSIIGAAFPDVQEQQGIDGDMAIFPQVLPDDWCGEAEPREGESCSIS